MLVGHVGLVGLVGLAGPASPGYKLLCLAYLVLARL